MIPLPPRAGASLPPHLRRGWEAWHPILLALVAALCLSLADAAVPRFFESNRMSILLLPPDTAVDSIIYRLRAEDSDRDYPLIFQIKGPIGLNLIYIEPHECTPSTDIFCEADVYLRQELEKGRLYIFNLTVSDQRGLETEVTARVDAVDGRITPAAQTFLRYSPTIAVREDTPPKTVISMMTVRKREKSTFGEFQVLGPASKIFHMTPANLVSEQTINGTLVLEEPIDFEEANLHTFKVCLLQPYTEKSVDTRNIVCVLVSVVVEDVQDEPPIFIQAPPVTRVSATAVQGDKVAMVQAKDGDRGIPRPLRYSILPSSSLYTKYFRMDPLTGEIRMNETAIKLRDKMVSLDPILMTVTADEVTSSPQNYPALSSSVEIAFVVLDAEFLTPKFMHESYVAEIYENSVPDTEVIFNSVFLVQGVKGLFTMEVEGDKGAFSVQPGVVKDAGSVQIKVKNSFLLDFESKKQINFKLIARQVTGRQESSASADMTVTIIDVNDNVPEFSQQQYEVEIYENITRGTSILRVYATDNDSGEFGRVRYTNISGKNAEKLYLDPTSGVITCASDNHDFDRELAAEYILTVEAKDNNGQGSSANSAIAKIILRLKDINDSAPRFIDSFYKGVLSPDLQHLRDPILIRAVDADAERPNNEVVYSLVRSTYSDFFYVDRNTGRLDTNQNYVPRISGLNSEDGRSSRTKRDLGDNDTIINLTVQATDLGYPPKSDEVDVKIFKQEYGERVIRFIYPKSTSFVDSNRRELETTLNALTGGTTKILNSVPLRSGYLNSELDPYKSDVTALVRFDLSTVIDVEKLMMMLNSTEVEKMKLESQQKEVTITALSDQNSSYVAGVVILCLILAIIIIILILCFCCDGCPLYKVNKSAVGDDGSEGVSYVRVDETARYRGMSDDGSPEWFQCLPGCMKDILFACGYIPPGRKNSRVAWSGDERQRERYGKVAQQAQIQGVEDRNVMAQGFTRQQQNMLLEDVDGGRSVQGQMMARQKGMVVDQGNPQVSEPRRVFVLKDALGVPRGGNPLQEGNTYLLEDVENQPRNAGYPYPHDAMYPPGNSELLRLQASPHGAAIYNEEQRHGRRADLWPEGSVHLQDDAGGGQRIHNQYVGNAGMGNQGYHLNDGRGYAHGYDPNNYPGDDHFIHNADGRSHYDQGMQGRRTMKDNSSDYESDRSRKHKGKAKKQSTIDSQLVDRSTDPLDRNTKSARSSNIPGTYGYQHTKTSILRYESNKAKIEEEREELIRQGKDPDDFCASHQGGGIIYAESRKGSMRDKEGRSISKLEGKRSQSQFSMPGYDDRERRGSLPEIETNLEKEAARRIQIRRNSGGAVQVHNADVHANQPPDSYRNNVGYETDIERTEEIERRIQQRRTEASEALSEELVRPNQNNSQQLQIVDGRYVDAAGNILSQAPLQGQQPNAIPIASLQGQQPNAVHVGNLQGQQPNAVPVGQLQGQQPDAVPVGHLQGQQPNTVSVGHLQGQQPNDIPVGHLQMQQPNTIPVGYVQGQQPNAVTVAPVHQVHLQNQDQTQATSVVNSETTNTVGNATQNYNSNLDNAMQGVTKESIEKAVASVLVDMARTNGNPNDNIPNSTTNNLNNPNANNFIDQNLQNQVNNLSNVQSDTNNSNTAISNLNTSALQSNNINTTQVELKTIRDKSIESDLNINNTNTLQAVDENQQREALRIMEEEINLGVSKSSTIFEKNLKNDSSILNIPKQKKKRNKMLEKKSVFTIAYDGMKTDQLRPDSAAGEP